MTLARETLLEVLFLAIMCFVYMWHIFRTKTWPLKKKLKIWHSIKPILSLSLSFLWNHLSFMLVHIFKNKTKFVVVWFFVSFYLFPSKKTGCQSIWHFVISRDKVHPCCLDIFFLFQWIRQGLKLLIGKEWRLLWHYAEIL